MIISIIIECIQYSNRESSVKIFKQLEERLNAAIALLRLHVLPILIRKIDADGRESILRPVDESQPHRKVTVHYVRPKPAADEEQVHGEA